MSLKLKDQIYFQERENLEGKKEVILTLNCNKCKNLNLQKFDNEKCLSCFLKSLYLFRNTKFDYISFGIDNDEINSHKCLPLINYFKYLERIKSILHKIGRLREKKCVYKGFRCKVFNHEFFDNSISRDKYNNPIFIYEFIRNKLNYFKIDLIYDSVCNKCVKSHDFLYNLLLKLLKELQLIKDYTTYQKEKKFSEDNSNFYKNYFYRFQLDITQPKSSKDIKFINNRNLIEIYKIGKNDLYKILIYKIPNEFESFYDVQFPFKSKSEQIYLSKIINDVEKNLDLIKIDRIISLDSLIKLYKIEALRYINLKYKFTQNKMRQIALLAAVQKLNLQKLFPLLLDDKIEEIFLDSPNDKIYLNHQKYGRCRTDRKFTLKEIDRIKTLLRIYSGKAVDYINPSIKLVLKNKYFYCRFAIDIEPINLNKFSLDIRKLNKNIFTIQDLLKSETINPKIAAFLYFNILRRVNITVTGETNTGKTTLINALDLLAPKEFRKLYVESITESLNQSKFERHQLKYKVDPLEASNKQKFSKQNQIKKLLHRTPDIIYLGEILAREEAEAMFHCLAAGLRGFQTIHSNDLDSLMNRLLYHFEINISCLKDLDLLILMNKTREKRKIISISEINHEVNQSKGIYRQIFEYNPDSNKWNLLTDLFNTNSIKKIRKIEPLNEKEFYTYIQIYEDIFNFLLRCNKITLEDLVALFDKISYFSFISLQELENFWFSWKQYWSLNS
ncbi:MAG: ATPase, T2SS/T4P/T4SS family [Candidatus Hermodarchaeota archaeon]